MLKKQKERSGMMNKSELDDAAALWAFFFRKSALGIKRDFPAMCFQGSINFKSSISRYFVQEWITHFKDCSCGRNVMG